MKKNYLPIISSPYIKVLGLLIGLLVITLFLIYLTDIYLLNIVDTNELKTNILHLHAGIIIFLTALVVCAGWLQLDNLNKTSKGDFLLRIDTRYSSCEIIKARTLIHRFYCQTRNEYITDDRHTELIGKEILDIMYEENESDNFIILINFLDFLETIAYFTRKNYLSQNDH